jgi:hypothetical protein
MFVLLGLVSIVTFGVLRQRSADTSLLLGALGFALFTCAWVGMYFTLKREAPDHPLVGATYFNLPLGFGPRRTGFRNLVRLVRYHVERHRADRWSIIGIVGLAMLAVSLIGSQL